MPLHWCTGRQALRRCHPSLVMRTHRHESCVQFVWLIRHQLAVLFSQNKPATSNQPAVLLSQNKPT
jgi:hypothetical protein